MQKLKKLIVLISFTSLVFGKDKLERGPLDAYLDDPKWANSQEIKTKDLISFYKENQKLFRIVGVTDKASTYLTVFRKTNLYSHWSSILIKQPDKEDALAFLHGEAEKATLWTKKKPNWNEIAVISLGGNYGMIATTIVDIQGLKGFKLLYNSAGKDLEKIRFLIYHLGVGNEVRDQIKKAVHDITEFASPEIKELLEECKNLQIQR